MKENLKIVATLEEIPGIPFKLDDYEECWDPKYLVSKDVPQRNYQIEIPARAFNYHSKGSTISSVYTEEVDNLGKRGNVKVPVINRHTTLSLVTDWKEAYTYYETARRYAHDDSDYQCSVMLYIKTAEKYIQLIEQLLPYFEEKDRHIVKSRIFHDVASSMVCDAALILKYGLRRELMYMRKYSEPHPNYKGFIDHLGSILSSVAAMVAEATYYIQVYDEYEYSKYHAELKNKQREKSKYPPSHPSDRKYRGLRRIWQEQIATSQKYYAELCTLAFGANPAPAIVPKKPIVVTEAIDLQVPRILLWSGKILNVCSTVYSRVMPIKNEEDLPLIDNSVKYIPPQGAPANQSLDVGIEFKERTLSAELNSLMDSSYSYAAILACLIQGVELLSLLNVRYKYLFKDDDKYFRFLESYSSINKKQYYSILESYLEKFIYPCLAIAIEIIKQTSLDNIQELLDIVERIRQDFISVVDLDTNMNCAACEQQLSEFGDKLHTLAYSSPQKCDSSFVRKRNIHT